jgi:DHA1 family bicyclomycin/chloramphenicol resistance-like MFS transporter
MNIKLLPLLLILSLLNSCIELEISAPSFLDIALYFKVTEIEVGLLITYNLLGFCIASLIWGPLSEFYGRRWIMLWGNGILTLGALGCVIAPTFLALLIARFVQGLGAATSAVVTSAIIADVYPTNKAAKLYSLMNAIFTIFMALSPTIGSILNAYIGWRGNYGVIAFICSVSWILLYLFLPETKTTTLRFSWYKTLSSYKQLLSNGRFLSAAAIPSLLYGCYLTFVSLAPFIYIDIFEVGTIGYTLNQGIIILAFAITSVFSNKITTVLNMRRTLYSALCLSVLGSAMMLLSHTAFLLTVAMSLFCIGFACVYPIIFAYSLEIFPQFKGTASSVIMSLRYLLCAIITGVGSYVYNNNVLNLSLLIIGIMIIVISLFILLTRKIKFNTI